MRERKRSEREAKENEDGAEGLRGGTKEDAKRKSGGEKSPLVSLFLFRDARLFTFHPIRVYSSRIYLHSRARMCVRAYRVLPRLACREKYRGNTAERTEKAV